VEGERKWGKKQKKTRESEKTKKMGGKKSNGGKNRDMVRMNRKARQSWSGQMVSSKTPQSCKTPA